MSLLLEALKKAEKAKEEAQRRASGNSGPAGLRLQEDPPPSESNKAVTTRRELPDISQPLEIVSDDITPRARPAAAAGTPRDTASAAQPKPRAPTANATEQAAERITARKVFEAKFKEPNPRLPFYLTMSALGVAAICTVAYFWYQLRPPQALVNTSPPAAGERSLVAVNAAPPAVPVPVAATATAIPGLPGASVQPSVSAHPAVFPAEPRTMPVARAARQAVPARPPAGLPSTRAQPAEPELERVPSRPSAQIHPKVESAYEAFLAGDIARARNDYQDALREEPANRDALLGLAATDVRSGRLEAAESIYVRLLRSDPRDAHAQSGLIALRSARMDPLVAESRVKTLLAADPEAHVLNFTLGNQLAQQGRWAEAQQQYSKAFAAEPDNADFAYNVAVSLDHLRQFKPALEYYRRALELAASRGASFDSAAARERITQLGN